MKRWEPFHSLKRFSPALPFIIGGSIILIVAGTFFTHALVPASRPGVIVPANTPSSLAYNIAAIQAHQDATPVISIPPPYNKTYGTPTPGSTSSPTSSSSPSSSLSPTATVPQGTPVPTSPPSGNPGAMLPPGSALPSDSTCAARVNMSSFEPRPDNNTANHNVPSAGQIGGLQPWNSLIGMDDKSDGLRRRVTGNYTGTTDEILQWVACKWGVDVNIVRAEAVQESNWHQSQLGDFTNDQSLCPPGAWNGSSCYQSYGILQIKYTYFKSEWPMSQQDTAFNADFVYGWLRNCYEGWADYLYQQTPSPGYPSYHAGDIWGCLGFWFSGSWYTSGAINYINIIKQDYQQKPWLQSGF
ncbi:MAG TPA: hypothetical protein VFQ36_15670 [Ktedonobacteraceae bacterium]|nr:hypothetical protein [Ktedonobacteraceae bacterium]